MTKLTLEMHLRSLLPPVGDSLVLFKLNGKQRKAIVRISENRRMYYLIEPTESDMYSSFSHIKGDTVDTAPFGPIKVWAINDNKYMAQFAGEPVLTVEL